MTFTLRPTPLGFYVVCDRCRERYLSDFRSEADRWVRQHVCTRGRR